MSLPRTRARRVPNPKPADSDIEIVEDGTRLKDEGYESGVPSDNMADEDEEDDGKWHIESDDVDEKGNLKGLIDDEVDNSDEDDEEDDDGEQNQAIDGGEAGAGDEQDGDEDEADEVKAESRCVTFPSVVIPN